MLLQTRLVWELHAFSDGSTGLRGFEIEDGMRGTCEGHLSCFVGGIRTKRKKATYSATLVSGYDFDLCEIAGRKDGGTAEQRNGRHGAVGRLDGCLPR